MIFVVIGTHEQPFNRLVRAVDTLDTDEERIVQTGYSTYAPAHCRAKNFMEFDEVKRLMRHADIVITHAGTGSIMLALSLGKRPIIAPRYARYREHVDDHQLDLVDSLAHEGLVIPYLDGESLSQRIKQARFVTNAGRPIEPDQWLVAELRDIIEGGGANR